jgi:tRNA-specific 2-thiouridylase
VLRVAPDSGEVRVGSRAALARDRIAVGDVRWLREKRGERAMRCAVQIRHHAAALPGWIESGGEGNAVVRLDQPAYGVAPGQAAVFYDEADRVLGGGWVTTEA